MLMGALMLFGVSCSSDDATPTVEKEEIVLKDLLGAWKAEGYRWDLKEGTSKCYLMTEDGGDFQLDENGDYITITIGEYCEQYAKDFNADAANEVKGTAEDFAKHDFAGTALFTNIEISEDEVVVYTGQGNESGVMTITVVKGTYTYDPKTSIMTVNNVAIPSDPVETKINVFKDEKGRMNFRYTDFDIFTAYSYDLTKDYWVYAPMIYYCVPGEPLQLEKVTVQKKRTL